MRPEDDRRIVAHLAAGGLNACQIADIAAIPRSTVRGWMLGRQGRPRAQPALDIESLPKGHLAPPTTRELLRGLIHSDGCRVLNRVNGKDYPRYFFTQVSDDIRRIFCDACRRVGVTYTWNNWKTVSIARAPSVALLDTFVGPKA